MQIITKERYEHIKRDPQRRDKAREDYASMQVWSPTLTEKEITERKQQVEAGILPF